MKLLGIYREKIYSPGKAREDAAILEAALREMARRGYSVHCVSAETLSDLSPRPALILSMAQSAAALHILEGWQKRGSRIVNSVASVRNCYRRRLVPLLAQARVPIPFGRLVPLRRAEEVISSAFLPPYWLKRGDVHAVEEGDVVQVESEKKLKSALDHFRSRKVEEILVQAHVEGEVMKFYGVGAGSYFSAFRSGSGNEVPRSWEAISLLGRQAAAGAGLEIYGGDAILTPEGQTVLIDLNDWPSFSRCCQSAAAGIAQYITQIWGERLS